METLAERLLKAREQRELNEYGRVLSDEERDKLIDEEDAKREREARESRLSMNMSQFMASVPPRFKDATFETYEYQTEKQLKVLDFLRLGKSAIIYGSNGTGKTHLAYASCKHQIAQGVTPGS